MRLTSFVIRLISLAVRQKLSATGKAPVQTTSLPIVLGDVERQGFPPTAQIEDLTLDGCRRSLLRARVRIEKYVIVDALDLHVRYETCIRCGRVSCRAISDIDIQALDLLSRDICP